MASFTPAFSNIITASELALSLLGTNQDAVGVFNDNFEQIIQNARPVSADVVPRARLMDHPLESGQLITDYKVILPIEILMSVIMTSAYFRDTYREIWNLWQNSTLVTVQTKTGSYSNMVISEQPHEERVERYDAILMYIRFRQVQTDTNSQNFSPAEPAMTDTQILGFKIPSPYTLLAQPLGLATTAQAIAFVLR